MKKITLLSMAAVAALAVESITIQKITVEAEAPKADAKKVEADEMVKFSRQSDLGEMLSNTVPEITMVRNSAIGNDIILRGFRKDNLNVTIDDVKVCGACPNRMDPPSMHISSSQIANINVQEGPFDVTQFGSLGGKINVVTKDPQKGVHTEVSTTLGSFDYRKLSTTIEGGNDVIQALVGFSRETSGQYKDGEGRTLAEQTNHLLPTTPPEHPQQYKSSKADMDAYDRNNYWAKIVGNIDDNQKLTLSYFGDRADDIMFSRYPMDALVDDTDMFKAEYKLFNLGSFSEELKLEGYHSKVTHLMGTDYRVGTPPMYMIMQAPAEATIKGAKVENTLELLNAKMSFGLDASKRNWIATKGPNTNPSRNYMLPDVDTNNMGLYVTVSKTISNIDLNGGVRYDDTTIKPNTSLQDNATNSATYFSSLKDKDYSNISANIMMKYNFSPTTNMLFGVGQSIRVPDAKELYVVNTSQNGTLITNSATSGGNQNLNETKNREIDLGFETTFKNFHLKAMAFYSDLKDYIYAYDSTWANIDAKIYGGDISADYLLNKEWRIETGIAVQKGEKKDPSQIGDTDKDLAEIPPLKGRVALVMDDGINYLMSEWIGAKSQTIDEDNGEKPISGYGILNLKYGHDFSNGFSLMTGINNFFDKTYAINNSYIGNQLIGFNGTDPLVLNEPGRNFYTTVAYKF
ncbi:MAG: TonB-dependent receptor [Epsilonproteobacteria bacterium]|nr:TonB-dependent receptor [Campylobacterota bacterium]